MRTLSVEEFFDMIEILYNDEDHTLTLKYEGNMAWIVDGTMVQQSNNDIMVFSNHAHNNKIFMNTGSYDYSDLMSNNISNVHESYKNSMRELEDKMDKLSKIDIDVCKH